MKKQLEILREEMKKAGATYYLMVTADPHASEYINDHYKEVFYFSGFSGSNALLLVGEEEAWLWTDGRYFVQAKAELEGSGITLMKMGVEGVPSITEFLQQRLNARDVLAFDGRKITLKKGREYQKTAEDKKAGLSYCDDLSVTAWKAGRPLDKTEPIRILKEEIAGETTQSKIGRIRKKLEEAKADFYFLSKLDDQMWLFNIRGNDIAFNPVCYAYTLFTPEKVVIFLKKQVVTAEVRSYFAGLPVEICYYEDILHILSGLLAGYENGTVLLDADSTSYFWGKYFETHMHLLLQKNPTERLKAIKNATEIKKSREVYLLDSVIVTRFLHRMKTLTTEITESEAADMLDQMRASLPGFWELSFPTISAYAENAAMMHYEAVPGKDKRIEKKGILLVDSGGQYLGGTTDVTRSIVLGPLSKEVKKQYTRVCCGMLRLMNAVFLKGCNGQNLDILAREPLWEINMDYKCGTGHGIGYLLNVHEGPQRISWQMRRKEEPVMLEPGMIVSDEPGVYVEGSHGIRIETILLCVEKGENAGDKFYGFRPLTFVPVDLEGIDAEEMSSSDMELLNQYHAECYAQLEPYMSEEEKIWLREMTRPVVR